MPAIYNLGDIFIVYATTGELMGMVRQAFGYSYDPMNIIESPFDS